MTESVDFSGAGGLFNINLDSAGNLNFNANNTGGSGDRRMSIPDDTGTITVGGGNQFGAIQFVDPAGANTLFIGANNAEATAVLGGGAGQNGRVRLFNSAGQETISMTGGDGEIRCDEIRTTSDVRLKENIAPLSNALDKVIALRGVRYQWKREDYPKMKSNESSRIGLIGQEVERVCPELVATDAEGYKSLNYSHLTAVLVEAIKEQQQLIQQQASALVEVLRRITRIEAALGAQDT